MIDKEVPEGFHRDHEFQWIIANIDTRQMICQTCNSTGSTNNWLGFLRSHQDCKTKEDKNAD